MRGLIAKKVGMTRIVNDDGQLIPVTLLKIEEQKITKILTPERDGYHGVQVGYLAKSEHKLAKADIARLRKSNVAENFTRFNEFQTPQGTDGLELGAEVRIDFLAEVKSVDVTGVTKGRGYEGAITRWGHAMGRRTHGSHFHRRPGSLGMRTTPGRVFKNKGMPGQLGAVNRTIQNLSVMDIDMEGNILAIKGSVPGHRDGYVVVRPSVKAK